MSQPTAAPADSIEFHCTGCGRALKVPASAAGRRASCPQCSAIVQVPLASQPQTPAAAIPPANAHSTGDGAFGSPPPVPMQPAWTMPTPPAAAAPPPTPPVAPHPLGPLPSPSTFKPQALQQPQPTALRPQVAAGSQTPTKLLFDRITAE